MSPPIVLLHGFAGHAESWSAVRNVLVGRRVEALTAFGHEPAAPATKAIHFQDEVARIVAALREMGEPSRLCGYSMGGRLALGVLAAAPEVVQSAIVVGAHPGLATEEERQNRAASDDVWVRLLEEEGIEAFATRWQAQPMFASQTKLDAQTLAAQRAVRLRHDARSLALAMTSLGLAQMPSYWDVLPEIRVPFEIVVGSLDAKFGALAGRMCAQLKGDVGRLVRVDDAGHNVLLERPELLAEMIANGRQ